jgi:hypothetical protein
MAELTRRQGLKLAAVAAASGVGAPRRAAAQSALEIMQAHRIKQIARDEEERLIMKLVDKSSDVKQRKLVRYVLRGPNQLAKVLIRFTAPRDVENTAMLTFEGPDGRDEQWLYLPASKKTRRIPASGKKNKFMGTEFTSEDLLPEAVTLNRYTLAGDDAVEGQACWIVEAVPASDRQAEDSGYTKRKLWVRNDSHAIVRREFYDKRARLEKVQYDRKLAPVTGTIWRAVEFEMVNEQNGNKTVLIVESRAVDKGLKEDLFTEAELLRGGS